MNNYINTVISAKVSRPELEFIDTLAQNSGVSRSTVLRLLIKAAQQQQLTIELTLKPSEATDAKKIL